MDSFERTASAYEAVSYPAGLYPQTHPDRLATIGTLRGMRPASVNCCRVLELGCGAGNNLITIAFNLPDSEFIGLDLAHSPIASGQTLVTGLGLENVRLQQFDVSEVSRQQFGQFDYILAHGLYSWVPEPVRERILAICRELLNPQGIAYISYNAQPGNHLHDLARGIMRYHVAHFEEPQEKIRQARSILKFLAESRTTPNPYVTGLKAESERVLKYTDEVFFHDDLSEINRPFYFHEFIGDAQRHSLQFVGEASPNELGPRTFAPEVMTKMKELEGGDELVREQYKDFFLGRAFRETLLCHGEVRLASDFLPERVPKLYAACDAILIEREEGHSSALFRRHEGSELETRHPLIAAALKYLCEQWPCAVTFDLVLENVRTATTDKNRVSTGEAESTSLANALTAAYKAGFVELHVIPPRLVNRVSERPTSSRLARFQLQRGDSTANQLHQPVKFSDSLSRQLVLLLDGSRDRETIARELTEFVRSGHGEIPGSGSAVDPDELTSGGSRKVEEGLKTLARGAMLIA
jgi:methyltransferase-like protein/2-polyprenyl-3-methyl-5-hydroxy-6-metoxy-1,4-benzoquinol methylase